MSGSGFLLGVAIGLFLAALIYAIIVVTTFGVHP